MLPKLARTEETLSRPCLVVAVSGMSCLSNSQPECTQSMQTAWPACTQYGLCIVVDLFDHVVSAGHLLCTCCGYDFLPGWLLCLQELMYVEKEVARRRILGLDVPDVDDEPHQQQQDDPAAATAAAAGRKRRRGAAAAASDGDTGAAAAAAEDDGEGPESQTDAAAAAAEPTLNQVHFKQQQQQQEGEEQGGLADAQAAVKAVLTGAIARLVYQNALKAAAAAAAKGGVSSSNYLRPDVGRREAVNGSSLEFRSGFLLVLGRYTSPGVRRLRDEIVESIREDFSAVSSGQLCMLCGGGGGGGR
jgi:hypothetical protein